jgi:hypothetical protein
VQQELQTKVFGNEFIKNNKSKTCKREDTLFGAVTKGSPVIEAISFAIFSS